MKTWLDLILSVAVGRPHGSRSRGVLYGFCAFGGFGSVLVFGAFFSLSAIIMLFVHPLSWLSCFARAAGALQVRLWDVAF